MANPKMFQYAVLWHPTDKQKKDDSVKSKVISEVQTILASDQQGVTMAAAMAIPAEYKDQLDQIEIIVRPF